MGDFNYPTINWNVMIVPGETTSSPVEFIEAINDCFMIKHLK